MTKFTDDPAATVHLIAQLREEHRDLDEAIARLFERIIDEARRIQRLESARVDQAGDGSVPAATGQGD